MVTQEVSYNYKAALCKSYHIAEHSTICIDP